jgi:hypothetical protein
MSPQSSGSARILPGFAQVAVDHGDQGVLTGQQRAAVGQHHGVTVDVGDPGELVVAVGDVVDVVLGGQPGPDVDELVDVLFLGEELDSAGEEIPVLPCRARNLRSGGEHLLGSDPVDGEVVLSAQVVVEHPRHIRCPRVHDVARGGAISPIAAVHEGLATLAGAGCDGIVALVITKSPTGGKRNPDLPSSCAMISALDRASKWCGPQ